MREKIIIITITSGSGERESEDGFLSESGGGGWSLRRMRMTSRRGDEERERDPEGIPARLTCGRDFNTN